MRLSQATSAVVEDLLLPFAAEDLSFSNDDVRHVPLRCLPDDNEANTLILAEIPELAAFFLRQLPPTRSHTHRHACAHKTPVPAGPLVPRRLLTAFPFF